MTYHFKARNIVDDTFDEFMYQHHGNLRVGATRRNILSEMIVTKLFDMGLLINNKAGSSAGKRLVVLENHRSVLHAMIEVISAFEVEHSLMLRLQYAGYCELVRVLRAALSEHGLLGMSSDAETGQPAAASR